MRDLISRSALLDDMQKELEKAVNDKDMTEFDCKVIMTSALALKNFVNRQPTAYDVEKVVAELEELPNREADHYYANSNDVIDREDAIEIVKQGGVSNDVCEWRLCDEEANVYDTSCRNPHILIEGTPKENNYEYCPYCGKKIKVVE